MVQILTKKKRRRKKKEIIYMHFNALNRNERLREQTHMVRDSERPTRFNMQFKIVAGVQRKHWTSN